MHVEDDEPNVLTAWFFTTSSKLNLLGCVDLMFVRKFVSMLHSLLYNTLRFDKSNLHAIRRLLYPFHSYILIND